MCPMKKYFILALIVLTLGMLAYYSVSSKNSTLRKKDNRFSVNMPERITSIQINSSVNETILEKSGEEWKIKDEPANQQRVKDMLMITGLIDAVSPVSESQYDSIKHLIKSGIRVSFYEGKTRLNSFRICKWNNMVFAQRDRSRTSFRIAVKGYQTIDLTRVFSPLPADWSSNILMDYQPDEMQQVTISYPMKKEQDFRLNVIGNKRFQLFDKNSFDLTKIISQEAAEEYLYFFSSIRYSPMPDSLKEKNKKLPIELQIFELEIKTIDGESFSIKGFRKTDPVNSKSDPYQFIALTSENDFILLNYNDFDPILVPIDYFLKK